MVTMRQPSSLHRQHEATYVCDMQTLNPATGERGSNYRGKRIQLQGERGSNYRGKRIQLQGKEDPTTRGKRIQLQGERGSNYKGKEDPTTGVKGSYIPVWQTCDLSLKWARWLWNRRLCGSSPCCRWCSGLERWEQTVENDRNTCF